MPSETSVVRRLYVLGFRTIGEPGMRSRYTSTDGSLLIHLDRSKHLALSADRLAQLTNDEGSDAGSIHVHRPLPIERPEVLSEAVLVANGLYAKFFAELKEPSGRGSLGGAPAWVGDDLAELLAELEQRWGM